MGDQTARAVDGLLEIPIGACVAHPDNPRRRFDATQLRELADSIRAQGILQPLLVRTVERGFGYQVIAGERRLRAAKLAGLEAVPAIVRELTDDQALACLVIENQQRVDVTPLEEARGYTALLKRDGWTADRLATEVGKSVCNAPSPPPARLSASPRTSAMRASASFTDWSVHGISVLGRGAARGPRAQHDGPRMG